MILATMLYSSWVYLPHYIIKTLSFLGFSSGGASDSVTFDDNKRTIDIK
jgi:hypothetical protein